MKFDFTLPILEQNEVGDFEITPWALTVAEFKGIYDADKRKDKKVAVCTLLYIAICEDYSLWGLKLPENKRLEYARRHSGIDKVKKDWTPHNSIRKARERYRELQEHVCVEMQMLFVAEKAIQSLTRVLVRIINDAEKIMSKESLDKESIIDVQSLIDETLSNTDKLSDRLDTLKKLQDKISALRREEKISKIRGGGQAGPRERSEDSLYVKTQDDKEGSTDVG